TAVTFSESAKARSFPAIAISAASQVVISRERYIDIFNQHIKPQTSNSASPVVIDTTCCPAFIKLNPSLLIFHRFKKRLGLTFAHLTFFFQFGLGQLGIFVRGFL